MDSQFITDKTREATEGIKAILEKYQQETSLTISEVKIDIIDTGSKIGNAFVYGKISLKLIA